MAQDRDYGFGTRAIHAGAIPDPVTGARATPIHQTTSFVFDSAEHAASLFNLQTFGNVYSRISNPTVAVLEERLASLEGGLGAVATASGQSAEFLVFAALAGSGDHIVASSALYGGTLTQLDVTLRRFGVDTVFVEPEPGAVRAAITERTKLVFTELVANPSTVVASTTSGIPAAWATSASPARSATSPPGLETTSANSSFVSGRIAAAKSAGSPPATNVVSTPKRRSVTSSWVSVPP